MTPTRIYMKADGFDAHETRAMARDAVYIARRLAPKLSGASSRRFVPLHGDGYFGIAWMDSYIWFQEAGIRAFTMRSLAGKTIPMWINDPTGAVRRKNPKARVRTTASGKTQVLIFRRAAKQGQRKRVIGPGGVPRMVPMSYPGAPGRIAVREAAAPYTTQGRRGGAVAQGNVGVRWRNPGMLARNFLHEAMRQSALTHLVPVTTIYATDRAW